MQNIVVHSSGYLIYKGEKYKASIGKEGITENKKEGDEKTPIGCFKLREIFYRKDRIEKPKSVLKVKEIKENYGWCNDCSSRNYNKLIKIPTKEKHEKLWRKDNTYDIIVPLGYNDEPATKDKGSAIFMHLARKNYSPTEGCIALSKEDLLEILSKISNETLVCVIDKNANS